MVIANDMLTVSNATQAQLRVCCLFLLHIDIMNVSSLKLNAYRNCKQETCRMEFINSVGIPFHCNPSMPR